MTMAEATLTAQRPDDKTDGPGKRRGRRPVRVLAAVVLVVVLVAVLADRTVLADHHKATVPVAGAVVSLPKTTLNLSGGSLLQVGVAIQLQSGVGTEKGLPSGEMARLENREITVLSGYTQSALSSAAGKDRSRAALLANFRQVIGPGKLGPGVMAVYYVDFIMQ